MFTITTSRPTSRMVNSSFRLSGKHNVSTVLVYVELMTKSVFFL
uniref:Uncharacterized protein n=1 Tax=Anguilla anguilla TaxID=7936 RepID=A0A0E9UKK1_ANGAN